MDWFLNFLGHGGFKLLIIGMVALGHLVTRKDKKPRQQPKEAPKPVPLPVSASSKSSPSKPTSQLGSPWSNGNPFDDIKK